MNTLIKINIKQIFLLFATAIFIASCTTSDDGYQKDISVNPDFLPKASFTASGTNITEGETISFTDTSTNEPYLWSWYIGGADNTQSNQKNVEATFNVPGVYSVILKVRNDEGADEIVLENYITVEGKPIPFISLYHFDKNLNDDGSNGITAVSNYGEPTYVNDRNSLSESAWLSPATKDQFLSIPTYKGVTGTSTRTIMARFKTDTGTSRKTILSYGTNASGKMFTVMIENDRVRIEAGASNLRSSRNGLNDGKWHHLAITYDPTDGDKLSDIKIYIDGELDPGTPDEAGNSYNSATTVINTDSGSDVRIGFAIYSNYPFIGELDDVTILDIVLIKEQISAIAQE